MTTYEYRCDGDEVYLEASFPFGAAPDSITCQRCGAQAKRVFSRPMIRSSRRDLASMLDRAEKTRTDPEIVTSLPPRDVRKRTPVVPLTPTLKRLPRP